VDEVDVVVTTGSAKVTTTWAPPVEVEVETAVAVLRYHDEPPPAPPPPLHPVLAPLPAAPPT